MDPPSGASEYFAAQFAADAERARLDVVEDALDGITIAHLERLAFGGADPVRNCFEAGAGGGSIARWLAQRVGPDGSVVAADKDLRFLTDLPANVEVRSFDITTDSLEPLHYDLVHCRLLLMHLADPAAAVQKLADGVAPGGLLLVEEWDYLTTRAFLADHPRSAVVDKVNHALFELTTGIGIDIWLGRRLPDLLEATGLAAVDHLGSVRVGRGTLAPTVQKQSTALLRRQVVERGLATDDELNAWFEALSDPGFRMMEHTTISAWARRPKL